MHSQVWQPACKGLSVPTMAYGTRLCITEVWLWLTHDAFTYLQMTGSSVSTPDAGKNAASHHALSLAQARPKQCLHSSSNLLYLF